MAIVLASCASEGGVAPETSSDANVARSSTGSFYASSDSRMQTTFDVGGFGIDPVKDAGRIVFSAYPDSFGSRFMFWGDSVRFESSLLEGVYSLEYSADGSNYAALPAASKVSIGASGEWRLNTTFPRQDADTTVYFRLSGTPSDGSAAVSKVYEFTVPWAELNGAVPYLTNGGIFLQNTSVIMGVSESTILMSRDQSQWRVLDRKDLISLNTYFLPDSGDYYFAVLYSRRNMICGICGGSYTRMDLNGYLSYNAPPVKYVNHKDFSLFVDLEAEPKIGVVNLPVFDWDSVYQVYYSEDSVEWKYYGRSKSPWLDYLAPEDGKKFYVKATMDTLGNHYESSVVSIVSYVAKSHCEAYSESSDSILVNWVDQHWDTTFVYLGEAINSMRIVDTLYPLEDPPSWEFDRADVVARIGANANYCRTEHKMKNQAVSHLGMIDTIPKLEK